MVPDLEAIALLELGNGTYETRVFSICAKCMTTLNDMVVFNILQDIIDYETQEKKVMTSTSRSDLTAWHEKYDNWKMRGWAHNRIELEDKTFFKF